MSEKYLNYKPIEIETLIGKGSKQLTMDLVNVERVKEYAAEDADVTLQLKHVLYPQVEKIGLQHLYFEVEEPMIAVLADIEMAGVRIDSGALTEYCRRTEPQAGRTGSRRSAPRPANRRSTSTRHASWARCFSPRCASPKSPR